MASRRGRRGRQRGSNWGRVWFLFFALVTAWGLFSSALTRPVVCRIIGAKDYDRARLTSIVRLATQPAFRVRALDIERMAEANPNVKTASYRCNLFGRSSLTLTYRTPVASIDGTKLAIDEDGAVFWLKPEDSPKLTASVNKQLFEPILCLCDSSRLKWAGELAKKLQVKVPKLVGKLAFDSTNRLCLTTGDITVVFGGVDRLDDKLAALEKVLSLQPQPRRVNLVEPDHVVQELK